MNKSKLTKAGVALVACAPASSVLLSQGAFAQGGAPGGEPESGFGALVGRGRIRPDDSRFRPAASLAVFEAAEASKAAAGKPRWAISQTILRDYFSRYLIDIPARLAGGRGGEVRPITAAEAALLEELFSRDLSKSRGTEVNANGVTGAIRAQDLGGKSEEVLAAAKARAEQKSKWYGQGSQGLGSE